MGPISYLAAVSTVGLAIMTSLYLGVRDDLAGAVSACNEATEKSIAEAETLTRETLSAAHELELADVIERATAAEQATGRAQAIADRAQADQHASENNIDRLINEANANEIPDSQDCLLVYALESSIAGLRDPAARGTRQACDSSGAGPDALCTDPATADRADTAGRHFSAVTYGDILILWGRDRATIHTLNARLGEIEGLGDNETLDR